MQALPIHPPFAPMEARTAREIPHGAEWQFEPKWDGFRCLAFRDGASVELQSKAEKPLTRYFPEVAAELQAVRAQRFVMDGELMVTDRTGEALFDMLLQRIHPAASRVERLAREYPARYVVFDLLVDPQGRSLIDRPLAERRRALERLAPRFSAGVVLSPRLRDRAKAVQILQKHKNLLDGIIAKRVDAPYQSGSRDAMVKVKNHRTADCVVGGFRRAAGSQRIAALLLGLYDDRKLLHYVGHCTVPAGAHQELLARLETEQAARSFTGRSPGGPSRWSGGETTPWTAVRPRHVVEVQYDQITARRFRHGAKLLRLRPDKKPSQCGFQQLEIRTLGPGANELF